MRKRRIWKGEWRPSGGFWKPLHTTDRDFSLLIGTGKLWISTTSSQFPKFSIKDRIYVRGGLSSMLLHHWIIMQKHCQREAKSEPEIGYFVNRGITSPNRKGIPDDPKDCFPFAFFFSSHVKQERDQNKYFLLSSFLIGIRGAWTLDWAEVTRAPWLPNTSWDNWLPTIRMGQDGSRK